MKGVQTSQEVVAKILGAAKKVSGCDAVATMTGLPRTTCYRVLRKANLIATRIRPPETVPTVVPPRDVCYGDWPPAWAYVVGWAMTDGSVEVGHRHVVGWELADRDAVEMIRAAMLSPNRIETCRRRHGTYYRLRLCGREITSRFIDAGVLPRKTHRTVVPAMPSDSLPHFLRGVFDGDGSIRFGLSKNKKRYKSLSAKITSCCRPFLERIRSLLGYGKVVRSDTNTYDLEFHCHLATVFLTHIYAGSSDGLRLRRKWVKWQEFLATGHQYGSYRRPRR